MSNFNDEIYRRPTSSVAKPAARVDPPLPACPTWCSYTGRDHGWVSETRDGRPSRVHSHEFGEVEAEQDEQGRHPDAFVSVVQSETVSPEGRPEYDSGPRVALAADYYPHFTAAQARRVGALLFAAADELDSILGVAS